MLAEGIAAMVWPDPVAEQKLTSPDSFGFGFYYYAVAGGVSGQ
jgi:hypothetical protein